MCEGGLCGVCDVPVDDTAVHSVVVVGVTVALDQSIKVVVLATAKTL